MSVVTLHTQANTFKDFPMKMLDQLSVFGIYTLNKLIILKINVTC